MTTWIPRCLSDGVEATITGAAGALDVSEVLHLAEWESREPAPEPPAPDSGAVEPAELEPDTVAAADTAAADPDPPAPDDPDDPAVAPEEEGPPLPAQNLILLLSTPLAPEEVYELDVAGVTNVNGLPNGGGVLELTGPALPPPPDPADADPADAPGDADPPADSTAAPGAGDPPADSTIAPGAGAPPDPAPPP